MRFRRARAQHFRLFQSFDFEPHHRLNFVTGANAAGKTSLLEALYVLARGDSHRGAVATLAKDGEAAFQIDARISGADARPDDRIEVRWQDRRIGVRINDQAVSDEKLTLTRALLTDGVIKLSMGKKKHVLVKPA